MRRGARRAIVFLFVFFCLSNLIHAQVISDSLVENLQCDNLSEDNIFAHIRSDSFSTERHWNIPNYSPNSSNGICNGIATIQRLLFYLVRFEDRSFSSEEIRSAIDILRGRVNVVPKNSKDSFQYKLVASRVFELPRGESILDSINLITKEWQKDRALADLLDLFQFKKNFFPYSFSNVKTVFAKSLKRNERTIQKIVEDLPRNRIHKINLFAPDSGHAVLPTSVISQETDRIVLGIYDPNFPGEIKELEWTPERLHYLGYGTYPEDFDLFASISDDAELSMIERVLVKHYKKNCDDAKKEFQSADISN